MSPANPWSGREKNPSWIIELLGTTGGAALVTVVLGGIVGTIITSQWQDQLRKRELSLAAYADYVKQEQEITKRAYELIGAGIAASDDLLTLTEAAFDLNRYDGDERKKVASQRESIRENFNTEDKKWRAERETLGLLMGYYHHGQTEVISSWQHAQDSVTGYFDCARNAYLNQPTDPPAPERLCELERKEYRNRLAALNQSFERARVHAWEIFDPPPPR
jgi:hypothetical protein